MQTRPDPQRNTNRYRRSVLALLSAVAVAAGVIMASATPAAGYGFWSFASIAAAPGGGVWTQSDYQDRGGAGGNGGTSALFGAPRLADNGTVKAGNGQTATQITNEPGTLVATPDGGYYLISLAGYIARYSTDGQAAAQWSRGDLLQAGFTHRPTDGCPQPSVVAAAMTPDGNGMWVMDQFGYMFTLGTAVNYGQHVLPGYCAPIGAGRPTGIRSTSNGFEQTTSFVPTPSGRGYFVVTSWGSVYTFGDAVPHGAFPKRSTDPITGIALYTNATGDVAGYWLVGQNGGITTFSAPFYHSSPDQTLPVSNITTLPGGGYAIVRSDGGAILFPPTTDGVGSGEPGTCAPGLGLTRHSLPPTAKACNRPNH